MRYLLLGSGLQGTAIAWDLLFNSENTTQVTVCDINMNSLGALSEKIKDSRLHTLQADVADRDVILPLAKNADVMISAVNYWFNASLTEVAIEAGTHFLDLGGNNDIVAQQFAQNEMAKKAGANVIVTACPFCMVNIEDAIKTSGLEGEMEAIDLVELIERHMIPDP